MVPRREQRSLFGEILDWMLAPLLLLWPMSVVLTWLVAQGIASTPYDRHLGEMARVLAEGVVPAPSGAPAAASFTFPAGASGILHPENSEYRYFQVLGSRGEALGGAIELPLPPQGERAPPGELRFRDATLDGEPVRVAYLWVDLPGRAASDAPLVQVAETLGQRARLATEIIKGVILPQFVVLPLAVLLVWFALARGIAPLHALQQRIRGRESGDLSPIDERDVPEEVAPLVSAINDLLARLDQSLGTHKQFLADAAHQLKTPLAGLRMQAELAQREIDAGATDAHAVKRSLQQIALSSQRAAHMVNQLLSMARAEHHELAVQSQALDLMRLAAETVRDFVPRAMEKRIDLGFEATEDGDALAMRGNPVLLRELIRNLVDNALLYTPEGGTVTVRVLNDPFGQVVVLQVEDSGAGIAPAERDKIFQPFYRVLGSGVDGSGLGLAIVQEIAHQHGAEVTVEDTMPRGRARRRCAFGPWRTLHAAIPCRWHFRGDLIPST